MMENVKIKSSSRSMKSMKDIPSPELRAQPEYWKSRWSTMKSENGRIRRGTEPNSHLFMIEEIQFHNKYFSSKSMPADEIYKSSGNIMSDVVAGDKHGRNNGDLYACLKPFFIVGRILGLIPISGFFDGSDSIENLGFRWDSIAVFTTAPILLLMAANAILSFLDLFRVFAGSGGGNASQLAFAAQNPLFYSMSVFVYMFFLLRARSLIALFTKWRKVTDELEFKEKDTGLFFQASLATAILFISAVIESILFTLNQFPIMERNQEELIKEANFTNLETYYHRCLNFWAFVVPYNPIFTVVLLLCNTIANFVWNCADIFIVICSRALYYKFKIHVDQTESNLLAKKQGKEVVFDKLRGANEWAKVRKDHLTLCKLLDEFEVFLSPLIFMSYSMNIFFICLELHEGLTPQSHQTFLDSAFSSWSFGHFLFRVLAVSLTAAKVNEYAHKITSCIQKCSTYEYCKELERLERMLATGPIGLSGLGCFVITRAFLLMVVSVIFTVEIVLLQASATSNPVQLSLPTITTTVGPS